MFKIKTVFRTLFLRCKHESACQSWLTQIDHSKAKLLGTEPGRSLVADLERYKVDRTWDNLDDFLIDRRGQVCASCRHTLRRSRRANTAALTPPTAPLDRRNYLKKFLNHEGQLMLFKFHRDAADFIKHAKPWLPQAAVARPAPNDAAPIKSSRRASLGGNGRFVSHGSGSGRLLGAWSAPSEARARLPANNPSRAATLAQAR